MTWRKTGWAACVLTLTMWAPGSWAQTTLPQNSTDALHALDLLAGVIFSGEVVSVVRHDGVGGASGYVEIVFSVQDSVRGVTADTYTVREWAGLWDVSDARYRVGQSYLMMLHAPGASGFSSPVRGMDGAIPIRGGGTGPQGDGQTVDLRWVIASGVQRTVVYRMGATAQPIVGHAKDISAPTEAPGGTGTAAVTPTASLSDSPGYAQVMELLREWEKNDQATQ